MATQQYGYGPSAWTTAKPTGPVDMPILSGASAVAPKFKPKNEYAGYAAKMVGELAYGAMAEKMAPQYSGFNELLGKDIYTRQPGSAQFAPEGGWIKPPNTLWASEVGELELAEHIKRREAAEEFSKNPLGEFTPQPLTFAEHKKQQEIAALPRPLTSAQAVEFEGFDPSLVPDIPVATASQASDNYIVDENVAPIVDDYNELQINTAIGSTLQKITARMTADRGIWNTIVPDYFIEKDRAAEREESVAVQKWIGADGGNTAFLYFKSLPNWEQELAAFEANPEVYFYQNILKK